MTRGVLVRKYFEVVNVSNGGRLAPALLAPIAKLPRVPGPCPSVSTPQHLLYETGHRLPKIAQPHDRRAAEFGSALSVPHGAVSTMSGIPPDWIMMYTTSSSVSFETW